MDNAFAKLQGIRNTCSEGTESVSNLIPRGFSFTSYPNPFNSVANISVQLLNQATLNMAVYDILGREVYRSASKNLSAGRHTFQLEATEWSSGVYFIQINSGEDQDIKKIVLLK